MTEVLNPRRARWRTSVGAAVVLVLLAVAAALLVMALQGGGARVVAVPTPSEDALAPAAGESAAGALVHVLGAVARPGVYELAANARVADAIAAAGGFTDDADDGALNLARLLVDGEQVAVPTVHDTAASPAQPPGLSADGRVNLNTADSATLETLPRVGPALAERIIAWREENGGFRTVEDLLDVSGIGERTFAQLKDRVSL